MNPALLPSPLRFTFAFVVAAVLALGAGRAHAQTWGGQVITGSGVVKTEARPATAFHAIALDVHARVELRQGDGEGLSITGDDNIVPLLETVVENGTLKIRWTGKTNYSTNYKALDIVVSARSIDGLSVAGSGQIHAAQLKADKLHATLGGSGKIVLDTLDAASVNATISGSGDIIAAGRTQALDVTVAGSGKLSAGKLECREARITMQGSGQAIVWAKESLDATVAGSGTVRYYGKPQLRQTIAGSGSVRSAGDAS
jgi:hypothetical protein